MSSSALTNSDRKYWAPIDSLVNWLAEKIPEGAKVLEIGPGYAPFPKATIFVDQRELPNIPADQQVRIDMAKQPLPFDDKSFDFVYCRHVLEDMYNPFPLMNEMSRVAKAGYIETPSPLTEIARGVDGSSPPFRGYHHHHYIVWAHEGQLRFVAKYPFIEYIRFTEEDIIKSLAEGPKYWNTHYLWEGKIDWSHRQNGPDYQMVRDYAPMLKDAMDQSKISAGIFWQGKPMKIEIQQGALPSSFSAKP